jgi:hypothetical protein
MAKTGGLGDNLYADGYNLSGDINALDKISGSVAPLDVTGIDKSAVERIGGQRDGSIDFTAFYNDATAQEHLRLSTLPTTDVSLMYCRGTALGSNAAMLVGKQLNYDMTRGQDGTLTLKVSAVANGYGLEWGQLLTAGQRVDTTGTNGTGVDFVTVSTALGWQAYLHVFALTGTNVVLTLQDSADNAAFANLTGGAFTSATGIGVQRLAGGATATVRRYLRVVSSGVFTSATFAVSFVRNATSVSF